MMPGLSMTRLFRAWRVLPLAAIAFCAAPGVGSAQQNLPPGAQGQVQAPAVPADTRNPACARLETQLASIERGGGDPNRAATTRRFEEIASKQQADLDRLVTQQRRLGCQSAGIFSIFVQQPPHVCRSIRRSIRPAARSIVP